MLYTRREIGRLTLAGAPAALLLSTGLRAQAAKPDSKWAGVQVGMNVPYNFGGRNLPNDEIIASSVRLGVSAVELRAQPIETFLGVPVAAAGAQEHANEGLETGLIELEEDIFREAADLAKTTLTAQIRKWRASVALDRVVTLRRQYEDAGVFVEVLKWDGIYEMADDEIDYAFRLAKAIGAKAISTEISATDGHTARLGTFADKHQLRVGYHGHATTAAGDYERVFGQAKFNGANVDIGHWVAGGHGSPLPFLREHAARITHVHVKDRRTNDGPNTPFGEGDTPIREVLQAMRDNKWPFQATVEFEYPIPAGSDRMTEIARALAYCRSCLIG